MHKVGDKVKVIGYKPVTDDPKWVSGMNDFIGKIYTIKEVLRTKPYIHFKEDPHEYNFHIDWVEPVTNIDELEEDYLLL